MTIGGTPPVPGTDRGDPLSRLAIVIPREMPMTRALLVTMLLLGACGTAPGDNGAEPTAAPSVNTAEEVLALSEPQRLAVLFRAIHDAGLNCQQVTGAERIPNTPTPRWRADCITGDHYVVDVGPNGTAYVTSPAAR